MRWKTTFVACVLSLIASPSAAQIDPHADGIGIYFDEAATEACSAPTPYTQVTAWIIATHVSEPSGISGWEASLFTEPAELPVPLSIDFGFECFSDCQPPYLRIALPAALPSAPTMTLARISTFYLNGPILFELGACEPTSFPDDPGPGYAAGDDPGRMRRLRAFLDLPVPSRPHTWIVAAINDWWVCESSPVEQSSWSAVKGLYR